MKRPTGDNAKAYFAVRDRLNALKRQGKVNTTDIAVADCLIERWRAEYCPQSFTLRIGEIQNQIGAEWRVTVSKALERLQGTGWISMEKKVCKRPAEFTFGWLKINYPMVENQTSKKTECGKIKHSMVENQTSDSLYIYTNTNIYIEGIKKIKDFAQRYAPQATASMMESTPTEADVALLRRYSQGDIIDALRSMERQPEFYADKRDLCRWVIHQLAYLDRKPSKNPTQQ